MSDDVKMPSAEGASLDASEKAKRVATEHRLFEAMRISSCYRTVNRSPVGHIVIPILLSMRTSGPDPKKNHVILELSWTMIGSMNNLDDQPCGLVKFAFDPKAGDTLDPKYMKPFGLTIGDYIKEEQSENSEEVLHSKAGGIGKLWHDAVVEGQKQIQAQRNLCQISPRPAKLLFLFYNDDNAIRFFYEYMLRYRQFTDPSYLLCGNLYLLIEAHRLGFGWPNSIPYPAKYNYANAFHFLPIESKIRMMYNFNSDLEFPKPLNEITKAVETDPTPSAYKSWLDDMIEKQLWDKRSPIRPIYSPTDEIHILLVIYCTLMIPSPWFADQCVELFSSDPQQQRIGDIIGPIFKDKDYWTRDDDDPSVMAYVGDSKFKGEWRLKDHPHINYGQFHKIVETHENRNILIVEQFLKFMEKLGLEPTTWKHYNRLFEKFSESAQIPGITMEQEPGSELWMGPKRPHDDWIAMFRDAVTQLNLVDKINNLDEIDGMTEMAPTGKKPLTKQESLEMSWIEYLVYNGISYDRNTASSQQLVYDAEHNARRRLDADRKEEEAKDAARRAYWKKLQQDIEKEKREIEAAQEKRRRETARELEQYKRDREKLEQDRKRDYDQLRQKLDKEREEQDKRIKEDAERAARQQAEEWGKDRNNKES